MTIGEERTLLFLRPRHLAEAFCFPQPNRRFLWKLPYVTLEEFLSASLDIPGVSSIISVGSAGERWGIGNVEYDEHEWRERVMYLMRDAMAILCLIGETPACRFENYTILTTKSVLRKTVFLTPPESSFRHRSGVRYATARSYYESINELYANAGVALPSADMMARGLLFTIDAETLEVKATRRWTEVDVRIKGLFKTFRIQTLQLGDLTAIIKTIL